MTYEMDNGRPERVGCRFTTADQLNNEDRLVIHGIRGMNGVASMYTLSLQQKAALSSNSIARAICRPVFPPLVRLVAVEVRFAQSLVDLVVTFAKPPTQPRSPGHVRFDRSHAFSKVGHSMSKDKRCQLIVEVTA